MGFSLSSSKEREFGARRCVYRSRSPSGCAESRRLLLPDVASIEPQPPVCATHFCGAGECLASWAREESQRDSATKPRVARDELRWVCGGVGISTLKGLCQLFDAADREPTPQPSP